MKLVSGIAIGVGLIASVVAAPATFATTQSCVDGTVKSNMTATLGNRGTVVVGTKNNAPLCNTVTLNFSSYSLPDNYNGKGFKNNPTAIPQTQFANTVVTLSKGMKSPVTATVPTPEACKATQIDLYYGPNQTDVRTSVGILNNAALTGRIYNGTGTCVTATSMQKTTPTPTPAPTPAPQPTPTALPSTGADPVLTSIIAALLAAGGYAAVWFVRRGVAN